jgi:tRNA(Ile)-lysidine synthase
MSRFLWTPLHAQVHRTIRQRHLLQNDESILVAVSGGQDSLCLIRLLQDLQPKWNWKLAIVHCDHRWRPDSQANADYVKILAETWDLPFYLEVANSVPQNEAQARSWRYECFEKIATQGNYTAIATGHTMSDRAETLLFNLIRGSGADGLQSLAWMRSLTPTLKVVRPLLDFTRSETGKFCQEHPLKIWEDSTNSDLSYSRNRIRHELLPYLKTHFNPQVEAHLAHTIELLSADVEFLEYSASVLLEKAMHQNSINRQILHSEPLALQRRVMRQFLQRSLQFSPNFEQVEKLVALISAPSRSRTDPFLGDTIAEADGNWIRLKTM